MAEILLSSAGKGLGYLNPVLLFGVIIIGGTFGARLFQRLHIPQVVGCIVIGILLGDAFGVISPHQIEKLRPFTMFALGIIGFMIGSELRRDVFKKYGRQFFIILLSEGIGAFILVAMATSIVAWFALPHLIETVSIPNRLRISAGFGLVLGAIASATAPAATVNVLWEYKTRGPLTATILAIVALDDALALLLYRGAATGAKALYGLSHESVAITMLVLLGEIVAAVALGILAGGLLRLLLKFVKLEESILDFALGCLLLIVGISIIPGIDPILPAMVFGVTVANLMPRQSKGVFGLIEKFSPPIYISFFVLAGAHIEFNRLGPYTILLIVVYILCRVGGKVAGSWIGAEFSAAPSQVKKFLGICLQSQAGVAIGLAILAGQQFGSELGKAIIMVVMTATFVTEIIGPMMVKVGVKKAGEVGLNITEEDLIRTYTVKDVMDIKVPVISAGMGLDELIKVVSGTDYFFYPVVDNDKKLIGVVTLDGIRNTFSTQQLTQWLVALDLAEDVVTKITPQIPLADALATARKLYLQHIPVVSSQWENVFVGVLDLQAIQRALSAEVLSRQQKADTMGHIETA